MRQLARLASYLAALGGGGILAESLPARSKWMLLRIFGPLAGSLSTALMVVGAVGATVAVLYRDWLAALAGLFGALTAGRYIARVTAPHASFEEAFGPDWQTRIPPRLRARFLEHRWPVILPESPGAIWERDLTCGTADCGDPVLFDLWQPPTGVECTGIGIIYLHGSGWHYLDKDVLTRSFFRHLAGQGHVALDVAYTLAPKAHLKEMVADVKRAIVWLKNNAAQYGVNPDRIVLAGGSAGAHLALLAAYTPNHAELDPPDVKGADTSVRAVISYYGPTDLRAVHEQLDQFRFSRAFSKLLQAEMRLSGFPNMPDTVFFSPSQMIPGLMGALPHEAPELYALGSPYCHVGEHCPPTLLLQGEADIAIRPEPVRALHRALRNAGVPSVYVEFPATDHGFDVFVPRLAPAAQAALYDVERFLAMMM